MKYRDNDLYPLLRDYVSGLYYAGNKSHSQIKDDLKFYYDIEVSINDIISILGEV